MDTPSSLPRTGHDDVLRRWTRLDEPPPPIARVARNRGLTPLQTYLRLLQENRINIDDEVKRLNGSRN